MDSSSSVVLLRDFPHQNMRTPGVRSLYASVKVTTEKKRVRAMPLLADIKKTWRKYIAAAARKKKAEKAKLRRQSSSDASGASSGKKRKREEDEEPTEVESCPAVRRTTSQTNKRKRTSEEQSQEETSPSVSAKSKDRIEEAQPMEADEPSATSSSSSSNDSGCVRDEAAKDFDDSSVAKLEGVPSEFPLKYEVGRQLGEGGFGSVFAGVRKSDNLPVAIKRISKRSTIPAVLVPDLSGKDYLVPLEVLLQLRAGGDHTSLGQNYSVSLIEWFHMESEVIIVMEMPENSVDLYTFLENVPEEMLSEEKAKDLFRQVIQASQEMLDNGVFHRDLKCDNILVQPSDSGHRVRIVDFGCGDVLNKVYDWKRYVGTIDFAPPEYHKKRNFYAESTSVWQVGAVMFELLTGGMFSTTECMENKLKFPDHVSKECLEVLTSCFEENPKKRPTLHQLLSHNWFKLT